MKKNLSFIALAIVFIITNSLNINAQCFTSVNGPSGQISGGAGPQTISATTSPSSLASQIVWSNGQTGASFTFNPDCDDLGTKTFTPCLIGGSASIPTQTFTLGPFSGSAPGSVSFDVSGICWGGGAEYTGPLDVFIGGSGNVSLTVHLPDGSTIGPTSLPISTVNELSANGDLDISLLGLDGDPNGTWTIDIGGDATSYDFGQTTITIPAYTLTETVCGPSVTFEVVACDAPCPTFLNISTNPDACSGAGLTLSAAFNPSNPYNVDYQWTGPNGFSSTQAKPVIYPENNTCDPVVETYSLTATCTNDGSTIVSNETFDVTIHPFIDESAVVVEVLGTDDPDCAVKVTAPCSNFTVEGSPTEHTKYFGPGDNGTTAYFEISNGVENCNIDYGSLVTCFGNCSPPEATVQVSCVGTTSFQVQVIITSMGDSETIDIEPSQGSSQSVSLPGTYTVGTYPNDTYINIKLVNPDNYVCNVNLNNITQNCAACPELTSVASTQIGDKCGNTTTTLSANVSDGVQGTDYTVKWQVNGEDIIGGVGSPFDYTMAGENCEATTYEFTAVVTCLNGGSPAATSQMTTSATTLYPEPEFMLDFGPSNDDCSVQLVEKGDCVGKLILSNGGATDPAPGSNSTVNYTARVQGAPTTCNTTGSYTVSCADCSDDAGNGKPAHDVLCWGESFNVENTGSLVTSPGYSLMWDLYDYNSNKINTYGPFGNPGDITSPANFFNNGTFTTGETYCFYPYTVFDGSDVDPITAGVQNTYSESGYTELETLTVELDCSLPPPCEPGLFNIACPFDPDCYVVTPGIYSVNITFSGIPYCEGLSSYTVNINVDDNTTLFNPFDEGAITSDFPAPLDEQHDDGNYTLTGYTGNPNGKSINITAVYINPIPDPLDPAELSWSVSITVENPQNGNPVVCESCNDVGQPACFEMLPSFTAGAITAVGDLCEGDVVNLNELAPQANQPAIINWYDDHPNTGGQIIDNPENYVPANGDIAWLRFMNYEDESCEFYRNITFNVNPLPVLSTPVPEPVCPGTYIDLTVYEDDITTENGTFTWYVGGGPDNGGAQLMNITNVPIIGSEEYVAVFENNSGCTDEVGFSFSFHPVPQLLVVAPKICEGEMLNLVELEQDINSDPGTFVWYDGDPFGNPAGNELSADGNGDIWVEPVNEQQYFMVYTNDATGCSNSSSLVVTVYEPPVLTVPSPDPVCIGSTIDVLPLEADITAEDGVFDWYVNDPANGGVLLDADGTPAGDDPAAQKLDSLTTYYVIFTSDSTSCSDTINFQYPLDFPPAVDVTALDTVYLCANPDSVDLVALEPIITAEASTFVWYRGEPGNGGVLLDAGIIPNTDPTAQFIANGTTETYYAILTSDATGCLDTINKTYTVYEPISGYDVYFDCAAGQLVVDLTNTIGGQGGSDGSGTTYSVDPNFNQDGDPLVQDDPYTVVIVDAYGCTDTVNAVVNCCSPDVGIPIAPSELEVCNDQDDPIDNTSPASQGFVVQPSGNDQGTPDFTYIVTSVVEGDSIVGLTPNGEFDFTGWASGDYCFSALVYNTDQINAAATELLGPKPDGTPYSLADLLGFAAGAGLISPFTIENVANSLGTISGLTGIDFCLAFQDSPSWCVMVDNCDICVPPPAAANPVDNVYCQGGALTALSVDDPGTGFVVNWYDTPDTGTGTLLGTGVSFTPPAAGTYYAEVMVEGFPDCVSDARTAVTLTEVIPPAEATVTTSATLCIAENGPNPNTLTLSGLITGGNTNGTWSEAATNPSTGNINGDIFDATGITTGAYTLIYTITADVPCADLVYNVAVTVIDCDNCVPPDNATNPQGATYCTVDPVPSISVDDPGTGFTVIWYNAQVGGNAVGSGAVFTPSGPGVYWAEVTVSSDPNCVSLGRVSAELIGIDPPSATISNTVALCSDPADGPTSVVWADIITAGQTDGTWAEVGGPSGGFSATGFDGVAAGEGSYEVTYTLTDAFCADVVYTVSVEVVNCANIVCNPNSGTPLAPADLTVCNDGTLIENQSQASPGFSVEPSGVLDGTPNYTFIVTSSAEQDSIVGIGQNGVFDFTGMPEGNYCFTGLAYNESEVDAAADAILDPGDYTLGDLFDIVAASGLVSPFTIENVAANLPLLEQLSGVSLCLNFGTIAWCVDVAVCNQPCDPPAAPVNPQNNAYCSDASPTPISVDDPGSGFVVNWYDAIAGGNLLGTGAVFTPTTAGTYFAEVAIEGFAACTSLSRTQATLTVEDPPEVAEVQQSATLCNAEGQVNPSTLLLADLILSGNTNGMWTEDPSNPATGLISGGEFNVSGQTAGSYKLIYTITATVPCLDLVYETFVNVIDCASCVPPDAPANPVDNSFCSTGDPVELSVDDPGTGFVITWYDAAIGGTALATGNTYTPLAPGSYWTETSVADDPACVSLSRTQVTLTEVIQPLATVTSPVVLCIETNPDNPTSVVVADLITSGDTWGVWSEPNGASGGFDGTTFDASLSGEGTYLLQYTLEASPCMTAVYDVEIQAVDCNNITCSPNAGVPLPPGDLEICSDSQTPSENMLAPSPGFSVQPSGTLQGTPNYTYVVTSSVENDSIIALSPDGSFDFTGYAEGDYCFTPLAYNEAEVDAAADALLGAGNYTLEDLLIFAANSGLVTPFTVANIEANLPLIGQLTGISLCTDFTSAPVYCATVVICDTECIPPAPPTNPQSSNYCEGDPVSSVSVTFPGFDVIVNWYSDFEGGTLLATGASFTPSGPGVYWAETAMADFTSCTSELRIAAEVTEVAPPDPAQVNSGATLCIQDGNVNPSSLQLSNMITGGNTSGSWSEASGNPANGLISGDQFSVLGQIPGTYTLIYTINANAPCADLTYEVFVNVIDCESCTPPADATNPVDGNYCSNESPVSISVDDPGTDYIVYWYNLSAGGTAIGSGAVFNPGAPGTYYAEIADASDETCVSINRVAVTLNEVQQPKATLNNVVVLCLNPDEGPTSVQFADLIASGQTNGVWAETGGTSGGFTSSGFDGIAAGAGVYNLTYTLSAQYCDDVVYNVEVNVIDCANVECNPFSGVLNPPSELTACNDSNQPDGNLSPVFNGFEQAPSGILQGTPNFVLAVTMSAENDSIIGLSNDGTYDFSDMPAGEYCFTALAYNETQVDAAADALLDPGNYTLADLLDLAASSGLVSPFNVENVAANLPLLGQISGVSLCLDFGDAPAYCITVAPCETECIPPATATNPQDNSYCSGSDLTGISVDDPGAGFVVNWYNVQAGGTAVGTGVFYIPASAGTYWAEVAVEGFATCVSESRVSATLTEVALPEEATVTEGVSLCLKEGGPNPSSITLSELITAGNTSGTWSEANSVFDATTLSEPGSYDITYTISADAPCEDIVYNVIVNVVDCDLCVQPADATNPQDASYCSSDAIPAISVDNPGTGLVVNWYETENSVTILGTGTSYLPDAPATYWAEVAQADDLNCVSANRVAVTLTMIEAPSATLKAAITLCNKAEDGETSVDVATLITAGDINGTWTETTSSGAFDGSIFDALQTTDGTYTLTYTISGTSPCVDAVYEVDVFVVDCANIECNPFVGLVNPPDDLEICMNSETPSENISTPPAGFSEQPSGVLDGTPDYTFIVTDANDPDQVIVGVADDGIMDFTGFATGQYCFTGLAYNAAEVDAAADAILGDGDYSLADLLDAAKAILNPLNIQAVIDNLGTIKLISGVELCVDFNTEPVYCVDVISCFEMPCEANAGTLTISQNVLCAGEDLVIAASNYNETTDYELTYLIAETATSDIVLISGDGMIASGSLTSGAYQVYSLNYHSLNAPVFQTGDNISDITAQNLTCFKLSEPVNVDILDEVNIDWTVYCEDNTTDGSYFATISISGGLPALQGNGSYSINIDPFDITYNNVEGKGTAVLGPFDKLTEVSIEVNDDGNSCGASDLIIGIDCGACNPVPGTMPEEVFVCGGEPAMIEASQQMINTAQGEVGTYVLYPADSSFTIVSDGMFVLGDIPGGSANTLYYVETLVGPDANDDGIPDLTSPCTATAGPTKLVFLDPISINVVNEVCDSDNGTYSIELNIYGGLPVYDNTKNYQIANGLNVDNGSTGFNFTVGPLTSGQSYSFDVTDELSCTNALTYSGDSKMPVSGFSMSAAGLCVEGELMLTPNDYNSAYTYNWDFGGAEELSFDDATGAYTVKWTTEGTKDISLSVDNDGCTSPLSIESFNIETGLEQVLIFCGEAYQTYACFEWAEVSGASGYKVETWIEGVKQDDQTILETEICINDLLPGFEVNMVVTALGSGICGDAAPSEQITCFALDCEEKEIAITNINDAYCIGEDAFTLIGTYDELDHQFELNGITLITEFNPLDIGVGTHTLIYKVQDDNCFYTSAIYEINIYAEPEVTITGGGDLCEDNIMTLTATGNHDAYKWSTDETTESIDVTKGGEYFVTVTGNGCSAVASVMVNLIPEQTPVIVSDDADNVICDGESINLSLEESYAAYLWSDNSDAATLTVNSEGTYSVTVTDGSNCQWSASIDIQDGAFVAPDITVSNGGTEICEGTETLTLSVPDTYTQYEWSTSGNGASIDITTANTYSVTLTNDLGCTAVQSITITAIDVPEPLIEASSMTLCVGETASLTMISNCNL